MISGTTPIGVSTPPRPSGPSPVAPVAVESRRAPAETSPLANTLAAEPPVDADRVRTIRQAIADGTYPIVPAKLADAMIAARSVLIDGAPL